MRSPLGSFRQVSVCSLRRQSLSVWVPPPVLGLLQGDRDEITAFQTRTHARANLRPSLAPRSLLDDNESIENGTH